MNDGAVNLFVVRTPLQLFNAIEARNRFHDGERNVLLLTYGSKIDLELMTALLDTSWHLVRRYAFMGLGKRLYGWTLASWLHDLRRPAVLYIGMITHIPLHAANVCAPEKLRLLDDGNETLLIARNLSSRLMPRRRRWLEFLLRQNLASDTLFRLEAFSLYNTEIMGLPRIENDYRVFKRQVAVLPVKPCTVFIGSNLVGNYFRTEQDFLNTLSEVCSLWQGELLYCPHRYESAAIRKSIVDLGIGLFTSDTILEFAFMRAGWCPERLVSFRSTAVDTLGLIYDIPGVMVEIPKNCIVEAKHEELNAVWHTFAANGGRVMKLG